ncbi:polyketide cyclase [Candidatus Pacearchaeota archaeon CG10_big_fil_rev_8_21_14_0_10_34_76]|nr:MAG: polyketide cyclase [Candidatus Pacearchaeota archaeon CG10_big_fil_rev_8_21_14_0_10_34_76]
MINNNGTRIKMMQLKNNVEKLNTLIREGKIIEAFDEYYGDDVVIQVNGNGAITGKEQNRKREMKFLQEIEKLNSAEIKSVTFGGKEDNVSMTEWVITIENKEGVMETSYRVNVQHWKDDKIINEKIYFCGDQTF